MSIRTTLTGAGTWAQIGTGPATVQLIAPEANGAEVMVEAAAIEPTTVDGLVLSAAYPVHHFSLAQAIWAQVVQTGLTATVAVQPEAT
jgi:hypothetical protein